MADNAQYPVTSALRRALPTIANAQVTKFDPSKKFREEEQIPDELGNISLLNGVDFTYEYDIELIAKPGFTEPTPLTVLTFTAPTAANTLPYPAVGAGTTISLIVVGEVKHVGDSGKLAKLAFKGFSNVNLPTPA